MLLKPTFAATAALMIWTTPLLAEDMPSLRISLLESGTVNWEITTITENELDAQNGFDLEVSKRPRGEDSDAALENGDTDIIVSDWLWVARQRAAGHDFVFIPYSKAIGGVVVPADSEAEDITDLADGKIGIAGGELDKSWLLLQAYAQKEFGMDLVGQTQQVYGSPPEILEQALAGDLDGAINYWHFLARMVADGQKVLIDVATAAEALGLDPDMPYLGYVLREETVEKHPDAVKGLIAASRAAKDMLANDDAAWEPLRPLMNAADDAEFETLIEGFRLGIPETLEVDLDSADKTLKLMRDLGGEALVGKATELPEGMFYMPEM
ncbi:ABC transporter substrate-binding protein [Palleronia caenipelagi]|uniref:ABC transporter substrate-binding protein n=1 Tax=Palleronia caenipelagi TaxID=2489174 RepID=A0A547PT66_9RHOB|nr:ABC transporter substrate-binding protein [Palleronia caenipelagi]TRD17343.1 ABC transporter substrate-binding protein [Palleronia caenipelagi]